MKIHFLGKLLTVVGLILGQGEKLSPEDFYLHNNKQYVSINQDDDVGDINKIPLENSAESALGARYYEHKNGARYYYEHKKQPTKGQYQIKTPSGMLIKFGNSEFQHSEI